MQYAMSQSRGTVRITSTSNPNETATPRFTVCAHDLRGYCGGSAVGRGATTTAPSPGSHQANGCYNSGPSAGNRGDERLQRFDGAGTAYRQRPCHSTREASGGRGSGGKVFAAE